MSGIVARRYAKALMNLAVKADEVEAVAGGLDDMADTLADSPMLLAFVADTKVSRTQKQDALAAILEKVAVPDLVNTFLRYLTAKRRFALLPDIREIYHRLADERLGRAQAEVVVAAPLSQDEQSSMRDNLATLSGKDITLAVKVDPAIMGGAITRIGSTVRDGSLRNQLRQIRNTIMEG